MNGRSAFRIALIFGAVTFAAQADVFDVTISDTLLGQSGYIAFDLIAGSPVPNNTVTVTNFATDGTLGSVTPSGSVTGSLIPGPLTLTDSSFFNEWLQAITYGTSMSFQFTTTDNFVPSGIPDNFSFYFLDSNQIPYPTSDTVADSLFSLDLNGPGSPPQVFTAAVAQVQVTPATPIPEPSLLSLTGVLLGCVLWRLRRARGLQH
jgi:hypothetical protein